MYEITPKFNYYEWGASVRQQFIGYMYPNKFSRLSWIPRAGCYSDTDYVVKPNHFNSLVLFYSAICKMPFEKYSQALTGYQIAALPNRQRPSIHILALNKLDQRTLMIYGAPSWLDLVFKKYRQSGVYFDYPENITTIDSSHLFLPPYPEKFIASASKNAFVLSQMIGGILAYPDYRYIELYQRVFESWKERLTDKLALAIARRIPQQMNVAYNNADWGAEILNHFGWIDLLLKLLPKEYRSNDYEFFWALTVLSKQRAKSELGHSGTIKSPVVPSQRILVPYISPLTELRWSLTH